MQTQTLSSDSFQFKVVNCSYQQTYYSLACVRLKAVTLPKQNLTRRHAQEMMPYGTYVYAGPMHPLCLSCGSIHSMLITQLMGKSKGGFLASVLRLKQETALTQLFHTWSRHVLMLVSKPHDSCMLRVFQYFNSSCCFVYSTIQPHCVFATFSYLKW